LLSPATNLDVSFPIFAGTYPNVRLSEQTNTILMVEIAPDNLVPWKTPNTGLISLCPEITVWE